MAERGDRTEAELRRLRKRIDAIDRRIVRLIDERADLALEVGRVKRAAGRRSIRDDDREREVLLRVAMAKRSRLAQADLLGIYRRLIAAMRRLEASDRRAEPADAGRTTGRVTEPAEGEAEREPDREPDPA